MRSIGNPELRRLQSTIEQRGTSVATLSRHLRHLSSVFEAAVGDRVIDSNPVPASKKGLKLNVPRGTTPFTDDELAAVLGKLAASTDDPQGVRGLGGSRHLTINVYGTWDEAAIAAEAAQPVAFPNLGGDRR